MPHETHLHMVREIFKKCRIQTLILDRNAPLDERVDIGLRRLMGRTDDYNRSLSDDIGVLENNTLYTITDQLGWRQLYLRLPGEQVLVIGPFASRHISPQEIWLHAERSGTPSRRAKMLEEYYRNLPHLSDQSPLYAVLETFAEALWGAGKYTAIELKKESNPVFSPLEERAGTLPENDLMWNVQMMERRYEYENELIRAVSNGQLQKVEMLLAQLRELPFERRTDDAVRNAKNYCIIMNTLLRKAAESGGVHPIHLDSVSSDFARKIEQTTSTGATTALMSDIFHRYCMLVRDHASGKYSTPVRRAVAHIESDLTADLRLHTIARSQNVNPSYLSSLFHKETGMTLTNYVNDKRIRSARHLLRSTNLQVQSVAQHCGIYDVNYFCKLFKQRTGMSPREYREAKQ